MSNFNKEAIIAKTKGFLVIFLFYFRGLKIRGDKCANISSPFRSDANPSFSVYRNSKGLWCYKDFGDDSINGDGFNLIAEMEDLDITKDFPQILAKADEIATKMESGEYAEAENLPTVMSSKTTQNRVVKWGLDEIPFNQLAYDFMDKYEHLPEVYKRLGAVQISGYYQEFENGDVKKFTYDEDTLVFAFKDDYINCAKIYIPEPKRFFYVGNGSDEYTFGTVMKDENVPNEVKELLVITGGQKDVLTFESMGIKAFCLNSETSLPPTDLIFEFENIGFEVVVIYDTDKTGLKNGKEIANYCGWNSVDLRDFPLYNPETMKDVSDVISNGIDKFLLTDFIYTSVGLDSPIWLSGNWVNNSNSDDNSPNPLTPTTELLPTIVNEEINFKGFDEHIYDILPPFIKEVLEPIDQSHEKALVLIGTLGTLSNTFNTYGIYDGRKVFPNLMAFVTAPASAGKGVLKWAKRLGSRIHKLFKTNYKKALADYNEDPKNNPKPIQKLYYVSGNSSATSLIDSLEVSDEKAVIVEHEADAINNAMKNDWGDYSDIIRRGFEHEHISKMRKEETVEINSPRLSMVITGTKDQLFEFIPSVENGLFSRFLFFEFPLIPKWKNVFGNKIDMEAHYDELASRVLLMYNQNMQYDPIEFQFTSEQKAIFNTFFEKMHNRFYALLGENSLSVIRRLGNSCFRIAMNLASIRYFMENEDVDTTIVCSDDDFETALSMTNTFINHAIAIFQQLPQKTREYKMLKTQEQKLFEALAEEFQFSEAVEVGEQLNIPKGTTERYLRKFKQYDLVVSIKHGLYRKAA